MELSTRIRKARVQASLTIRSMAKQIGVSHATVGHWETGKHSPSVQMTKKVAELTGVAVSWLIAGQQQVMKTSQTTMVREIDQDEIDAVEGGCLSAAFQTPFIGRIFRL